jgi:hypothetical protein
MFRASFCAAVLALLVTQHQSPPGTSESAAEPHPQTRPATSTGPAGTQPAAPRTLRRPAQAEIIENLLRDRDRTRMVVPPVATTRPASSSAPAGRQATQEPALLVDGTVLVERPGRLVRDTGRPMFVFLGEGTQPQLQTMELLPNQLLEAMEHEAERGYSEFIISARVTAYRGKNYLLLLKVLRRTPHGNLAP